MVKFVLLSIYLYHYDNSNQIHPIYQRCSPYFQSVCDDRSTNKRNSRIFSSARSIRLRISNQIPVISIRNCINCVSSNWLNFNHQNVNNDNNNNNNTLDLLPQAFHSLT
ncbi:hypothetical protein DERP_015332 [Dermatophagoides pteronyssinus]|uniref:Uncharacterized protein n=1 Tax=Dermatophagoides pteronyssinus TaxID=6956 RepID=A0ABQ8IRV4_DERPT|nr:hypothetical protein DERP_015332 [Dermatophagoides pteronyssinus]